MIFLAAAIPERHRRALAEAALLKRHLMTISARAGT
jgi:hypothetical protein